jgi:pimeloyl-ACP methyl ester carboxylesterase
MLHYLTEGAGDINLVLLHGYCENNTCFNEQVLFFKDHCKVITIDLPGFGKSKAITGISIDGMAQEVKKVLDGLNLNHCVLMGHSMGGYVALAFAELFPEFLRGLGLIHSTAVADTPERKLKRNQVIDFITKHGKEPFLETFIPALFKEPASKEHTQVAVREALVSSTDGIIEAAKAMRDRPDRTHILSKLTIPVFFAVGKYDSLIPEQAMFEQAASCQIAHIAYLSNSAHMGMVEEAALLNEKMLVFLMDFCLSPKKIA